MAAQLFNFVKAGDLEKLKALLTKEPKINVNEKNDKMQTALYWACEKKDPEIAEVLINNGANIEETELYGFTPLHLSSFLGNERIVLLLLERGARVNSTTKVGATPLHLACKNHQLETAKLLIQRGADPNVKDEKGQTPFEVSKNPEFTRTIQAFIEENKQNSPPDLNEAQTLRQLVSVLKERLSHEQENLAAVKNSTYCLKCKSEPRDTVTVPCMHLLCCYKCVIDLPNCFVCDRDVEGLLRCNMSE